MISRPSPGWAGSSWMTPPTSALSSESDWGAGAGSTVPVAGCNGGAGATEGAPLDGGALEAGADSAPTLAAGPVEAAAGPVEPAAGAGPPGRRITAAPIATTRTAAAPPTGQASRRSRPVELRCRDTTDTLGPAPSPGHAAQCQLAAELGSP